MDVLMWHYAAATVKIIVCIFFLVFWAFYELERQEQ